MYRRIRLVALILSCALVAGGPAVGFAQEAAPTATPAPTPEPTPTPEPLPSSNEAVQPYLGTWAVTSTFQGNPVSADIELKDVEGFVAGTFKMAFLPQPQPIDSIQMTDEGIVITTSLKLGQNAIVLTLAGALQDGKIVGTIKDKMGLMTSDFEAVKSDPELDPFMGVWSLDVADQEHPVRVDLFKLDGHPTGFVMPDPEGYPTAIEGVTKTEDGLDLLYDVNLPTGRVEVTMSIRREGQGVAGTIRENTGTFSHTFTGAAGVPELPSRYASDLDTAGLEPFLGPWTLASSFQGNDFTLDLQLLDVDGKLGGVIEIPLAPEPLVLRSIASNEDKLLFAMELDFGGPRIDLNIEAGLAENALSGRLFDSSGFFDAEFTGKKGRTDEIAIARAIASASGVAPETGGDRRRGRGSTIARLNLGERQFRILYRPVATSHADYETFQNAKPGEVILLTGSRVPKLYTDVDMQFGDTVVSAHNFTETYPGVYGLWLKRTAEGWNLIFNRQGDAWGTMYDPAHDMAEISLTAGQLAEPAEELTFELLADGAGAVLLIQWGEQALSAPFSFEP